MGAVSAFNKHGVAMVSYDLIAEESHMSRQLVRHYFPNAQTLMLAVCDQLSRQITVALESQADHADPMMKLNALLDVFFGNDLDFPLQFLCIEPARNALISMAPGNEEVRERLAQGQEVLRRALQSHIVAAYPTLQKDTAYDISYVFITMIHGHWRTSTFLGKSQSHMWNVRDAMDRLIQSHVSNPAAQTTCPSTV